MTKKLLLAASVLFMLAMPALADNPNQIVFINSKIDGTFTANNPCYPGGDPIAGTFSAHIIVNLMTPNGGLLWYGLDNLRGNGVGARSGFAYKVRAKANLLGYNGPEVSAPANGAYTIQDDFSIVLDPIGKGTMAYKFTAWVKQGVTINENNVNNHLNMVNGVCGPGMGKGPVFGSTMTQAPISP